MKKPKQSAVGNWQSAVKKGVARILKWTGIGLLGMVLLFFLLSWLFPLPDKVEYSTIYINKQEPLSEPVVIKKDLDLTNKTILIVDDVGNSGRTLFYALQPLAKYHLKKIIIAVFFFFLFLISYFLFLRFCIAGRTGTMFRRLAVELCSVLVRSLDEMGNLMC